MYPHIIIAIDGYSSCGKSTVAKALAKKLHLRYIDSGAMYRAVTLFFLRNNIPIPDPNEVNHNGFDYLPYLDQVHISFKVNSSTGFSEVYLNGENVEEEIRSMEISENVSHVSSIREVRQKMVHLQQLGGIDGGLVMDGRDIGTTVFPDADLKIFMKADPEVRAQRRHNEMVSKGMSVSREEVINNLVGRDYEDSHREESPLRKAQDAVVLDNSKMNFDEQVDFVMVELNKIMNTSKEVLKA
ncbi:MAG: (d)CMP kinase [Bacteroidota bacterium]